MGNATPFSVQQGDPSSYRSISAMQMLPFPGKLKLREGMAGKDVQAAAATATPSAAKLVGPGQGGILRLLLLRQGAANCEQDKDLLQKLSRSRRSATRVGEAMQQDVLEIAD